MKKTLLATSALAFAGALAAGQAGAADKLSVGLSGYMEQWVGFSNIDGKPGNDGAMQVVSDSEFNVKGSLEADNGLKFSVKIEVEGNAEGSQIDESVASVSGEFGTVHIGAEDDVHSIMHYGQQDVGIGLNDGDVKKWLGTGSNFSTSGWRADAKKIIYYSPRIGGVQLGMAYTPNTGSEASNGSGAMHNDDTAWSASVNFKQDLAGASVAFSLGHYSVSSSEMMDFDTMPMTAVEEGGLTKKQYDGLKDIWAAYEAGVNDGQYLNSEIAAKNLMLPYGLLTLTGRPAGNQNQEMGVLGIEGTRLTSRGLVQRFARAAKDRLGDYDALMKTVSMGVDDKSVTNVGLRVGFGAFSFNTAYAMYDNGMSYMLMADNGVVIDPDHMWDHDRDGADMDMPAMGADTPDDMSDDMPAMTGPVNESAMYDDPANDKPMSSKVVEAPSTDSEVVSVGVMYSAGPMAASLGYSTESRDNGMDASAVMFSFRYTLAPGVNSKTSIVQADDGMVEGTAFVTGLTIGF